MKPLFPFGHGLSYTSFTYSNLKVSEIKQDNNDNIDMTVTVTVTNNGAIN